MRKEKGDGMRKQATYEHLTIQPLDGHHLVSHSNQGHFVRYFKRKKYNILSVEKNIFETLSLLPDASIPANS